MDVSPTTYHIEGREYFLMVKKLTSSNATSIDSAFFRTDANGYVFETSKSLPAEINRYRLSAKHDESWKLTIGSINDILATVGVIDLLKLSHVNLEHCKSYYFDSPTVVDE